MLAITFYCAHCTIDLTVTFVLVYSKVLLDVQWHLGVVDYDHQFFAVYDPRP